MATDVSMRRPPRELSHAQRQRVRALLDKPSLQPTERGELAALARHGSDAQQQEAEAKLGRGRAPTVREAGTAIAEGIGRVLNDEGR